MLGGANAARSPLLGPPRRCAHTKPCVWRAHAMPFCCYGLPEFASSWWPPRVLDTRSLQTGRAEPLWWARGVCRPADGGVGSGQRKGMAWGEGLGEGCSSRPWFAARSSRRVAAATPAGYSQAHSESVVVVTHRPLSLWHTCAAQWRPRARRIRAAHTHTKAPAEDFANGSANVAAGGGAHPGCAARASARRRTHVCKLTYGEGKLWHARSGRHRHHGRCAVAAP